MDVLAPILMIAMLAAAGILSALRGKRRRDRGAVARQVHRQHLYLFQGGHLGEAAVESCRRIFERMFNRGDVREAEETIKPGTKFVAQVRALAEIGSDAAAVVLERQLDRRHCCDSLEQSWYWLDVACALRTLKRNDCLPTLMRRVAERDLALNHFLAAETVCFPGFQRYLELPQSVGGRAAARTLVCALAALRNGVQPHAVVVGRLGDAIETVWRHGREPINPLAVQVFREALRLNRRADHAERFFENDSDRLAFREQIGRVEERFDAFCDYLEDSVSVLLDALSNDSETDSTDLLQALIDLRADAAALVIPMIKARRLFDLDKAIEVLSYSRRPSAGAFLRELVEKKLRGSRVEAHRATQCAIRALRNHPCEQSERTLLAAATHRKPAIRIAGLSSLGWWEPIHREAVLACLKDARLRGNATHAAAAEAALARLGERHALRWFRQQLAGENSDSIHQTIQRIADEGILLLWPDVDALADADDRDVAFHACDALEQLREDCVVAASAR
jgi:hypothetical protein